MLRRAPLMPRRRASEITRIADEALPCGCIGALLASELLLPKAHGTRDQPLPRFLSLVLSVCRHPSPAGLQRVDPLVRYPQNEILAGSIRIFQGGS